MPKNYNYNISEPTETETFEIETPSNIYVVSKTKSGKSFLLKHLLICIILAGKTDEIYIQGKTMDYVNDYDNLFPLMTERKKYINKNQFNIEQLKKVYKRQRETKKEGKPMKNVIFLLDDIIGCYRSNSLEANFISELTTHSRHLNITLIISVQHAKGILNPMIRENATNLLFSSITKDAEATIASMCHVEKEAIAYITARLNKYEFCYYTNDGDAKKASFLIVKVKSDDEVKGKAVEEIEVDKTDAK